LTSAAVTAVRRSGGTLIDICKKPENAVTKINENVVIGFCLKRE